MTAETRHGRDQAEECAEPSVNGYHQHVGRRERPCEGCNVALNMHVSESKSAVTAKARERARYLLAQEFPDRYKQLLEQGRQAGLESRLYRDRARSALVAEQRERFAVLHTQTRAALGLKPVKRRTNA